MKNNNNLKNILIIVFFLVCVLAVLFIPKLFKNNDEGVTSLKYIEKDKYKVNEYIPVYVDDMQMSKKYLNDFINYLLKDIDGSYELIDIDYRTNKFNNINEYKQFIYDLKIPVSDSVIEYATYELNGYKYYDIYDKQGNRFIFKTNGVMQYKVLFDLDKYDGDD